MNANPVVMTVTAAADLPKGTLVTAAGVKADKDTTSHVALGAVILDTLSGKSAPVAVGCACEVLLDAASADPVAGDQLYLDDDGRAIVGSITSLASLYIGVALGAPFVGENGTDSYVWAYIMPNNPAIDANT